MAKKFNHAMDLGFEVNSNSETDPTPEEIIEGLEKRVRQLKENAEELKAACNIFDTQENE